HGIMFMICSTTSWACGARGISLLREFQAEYKNGDAIPSAHVRLNAKLVRLPQRVIVATKSAAFSTKAKSGALIDAVHAFDESLGRVLKQIVEWALSAVPPKLQNSPRLR
ncbi:MAG: hypothetical protein O3C34_12620, partial [Proteobacteria bacterium]|nr:hypothetical protein [Pseudomonadota bacterium]